MAGHPNLVPDRFFDLVLYLVIQKRRRCRIPNLVPTTHTNFEFRRLYVFFEGLVISIRCRLRRLLIQIITTRTLFYKFVCLVYVIVFSLRVFVLFS